MLLCTLSAISLRRSVGFLLPKAAFLSREALRRASNLSLSSPLPVTGASFGRRGESCLGETALGGGGESSVGRKLSESSLRKEHSEKGEKGSGAGSSGEASEMEISGTGERASMLTRRRTGSEIDRLACELNNAGRPAPVNTCAVRCTGKKAGSKKKSKGKERKRKSLKLAPHEPRKRWKKRERKEMQTRQGGCGWAESDQLHLL